MGATRRSKSPSIQPNDFRQLIACGLGFWQVEVLASASITLKPFRIGDRH
jgi:hypothetical protein